MYRCRRLAREPLLDGKVREDPAWKNILPDSDFVVIGNKVLASKQTYFRIAYTPESLFIAIECKEPEIEKIKAELKDAEHLCREDSVEIFIFPQGEKNYHQFMVNAIGSRWNRIARDRMTELSLANWQASTHIGENYWSAELKLPFAILGAIPEKNEEWRINICRNIPSMKMKREKSTTWAYMQISFHEPRNFGKLVFIDKISSEERMEVEKKLKRNIFLFSKLLAGTFLEEDYIEKRVALWNGIYVAPRLSPNGKRILLHSTQGGKIGIWLTDLKGKNLKRLGDGDQGEWSPDGKRIVLRSKGRIIEKELVSGEEKIISPKDWFSCAFPSYLPDGRIIFVLKRKENDEIYLINPNKKTPPELSIKGEIESTPKCSSDGKKVAYQNGAHIYLMDLEKKEVSQLTTAGGVQSWPVWSNDNSICYCQSPGFFDGPWDICNVEIKNPQTVDYVKRARYLNISFDWRGSSPATATIKLKGKKINLLKRKGEIEIENDWLILCLSSKKNKIFLIPKEKEKFGKEILFIPLDKQEKPARRIKSIHILKNDGENVTLKASFYSKKGNLMKMTFRVSRAKPFIEIKPIKNVNRICIKRKINLALLPDRFANDLILNPLDSESNAPLPYTPLLVGLLPENKKMLIVITPSDRQRIKLIRSQEKGFFEKIAVSTGKESIFVSLLSERNLWYQREIKWDSETKEWKVEWSAPFHAQWRLAIKGKKNYSRMWNEEALSKLKEDYLPIEEKFSKPPELAIVYAYGRSWHTPLHTLLPMDILRDSLGVKKYKEVLDIEGIRTYRDADEWVPFLDFPIYFEILRKIRMAKRKGVELTVTHLCNDIFNLLKGLDNRRKEYENFLVGLKSLCREHKKENLEAEKFLTAIEKEIVNLQSRCVNLPITEIGKIPGSFDKIKKGGLGRFKEAANLALQERQKLLTEYREFTKKLRGKSSFIITEELKLRDIAEDIRERTQNILRRRYYLEGDWQGEEPSHKRGSY